MVQDRGRSGLEDQTLPKEHSAGAQDSSKTLKAALRSVMCEVLIGHLNQKIGHEQSYNNWI